MVVEYINLPLLKFATNGQDVRFLSECGIVKSDRARKYVNLNGLYFLLTFYYTHSEILDWLS